MGDIYQMEKNGFTGLVGYTVKQIEELLASINFVSINGNSVQQGYKLQESDKAIIAVEIPRKKKILIKD